MLVESVVKMGWVVVESSPEPKSKAALHASEGRAAALAFGNFDGVHVGHRMLIDQLRAVAAPAGLAVTVLTFAPHPLTLLWPERAPLALDTLNGRRHWLTAAGVDRIEVVRFDRDFSQRSARWFADSVIFGRFAARVVIASDDSRFGVGGRGDLALLRERAAAHGARVLRCPAVVRAGEVVSSSRVRRLITAGELGLANELLGRPFAIRGEVVHGDARGRTLGFPTANIALEGQVRPAPGVYAGRLEVDGELHDAVCNLGVRPTVDGDSYRVEAHLLGWRGDLYDKRVSLHLHSRLRGERRFTDLGALSAQIQLDCVAAQARLQRGGLGSAGFHRGGLSGGRQRTPSEERG